MNEREQWRPVVGWEGLYEVSSFGAVRKLPHQITKRAGEKGQYSYTKRGGIISRHQGGSRRASVRLYAEGRSTTLRVVNIVLDAFVLAVPDDHGLIYSNNDETDCSLNNLIVQALTLPGEVWRKIPSAHGYEASSLGRVRSLTRRYTRQHRGTSVDVRIFGRILAQSVRGKKQNFAGYPVLNLARDGHNGRSVPVHHVVAEAFHGPRPVGQHILHCDGSSLNPRPENLRYGTVRENIVDMRVKAFADLAGITLEAAWAIIERRSA